MLDQDPNLSAAQIIAISIGHSLQIALGVILAFLGMDIIHSGNGPDDPDGFA